MKFSDYFNLNKGQSDLDFVNIFLNKDIKLFIDPWALKECGNVFCQTCVSYINNFFELLIERIKNKEVDLARDMLSFSHEVKEIHLGDSVNSYRGLGMAGQTEEIYKALSDSNAIKSGLIQDLEDCALMIDGINRDKISDMIANIIKFPLAEYTAEQCRLHGIPTEKVSMGYCWDNKKRDWVLLMADLPVVKNGAEKDHIILVPKWIVRHSLFLNYGEYFDIEIMEFEQARHLNAGTALVRTLKDGTLRPPTKKDLKKKIEKSKKTVVKYTEENPELLIKFKERKQGNFKPISNVGILIAQGDEGFDFNEDINSKKKKLSEIISGQGGAYDYQNLMVGILELIFYPHLSNPRKEYPLADKTKKVDIVFQNSSSKGFFMDLSRRAIPSVRIYFECKNYNEELNNPEVDQLAGRLGVNTGKIGFLLCRKIENKKDLLVRCKFIATNQKNYIICLDDNDVCNLLELKRSNNDEEINKFLEKKLEELIS